VVHRTRYGGEWSLPKGKVQAGESWEKAALREVKEETNCDAGIRGYAGTIAYMSRGAPKIVVFWHMAPVEECTFRRSAEVDRIEWLDLQRAIKQVKYPEEKRLLGKEYRMEGAVIAHRSSSANQRFGSYGSVWSHVIIAVSTRRSPACTPESWPAWTRGVTSDDTTVGPVRTTVETWDITDSFLW
jgi:ADP-ribose pyrophosphatase YjhB (NUDIX family)